MSQVVASGTTGACIWELTGTSDNYTLTISGTGAMGNYSIGNIPWNSYRDDITTLNLQQGVATIGDWAFSDCIGLTSVTIPNSVTAIESSAFRDCSGLTSVTIPNSVTTIGDWAFSDCRGLTSVTIPNSVAFIGERAFYSCRGLTSVTIPNSVASIGNYAFYYCSGLTSVTIPNLVTSIGDGAFSDCSGLTSVTIPNSVTAIGERAFSYCRGLTSVINLSLVPQIINSDVFYGVNKSNCSLIVPTSSVSAYQNAAVWQDFAPNITGGGILLSANSKYPLLGSVSGNIPNGLYLANTDVTLTATFPVAYSFGGWMSGANNLSNDNPFSFTLTQDTVITADFGKPANFSLAAAGTLKNQTDIKTITHLTLTGNLDARDIQFMRDSMPFLSKLDLSGVTIVAYTGTEGTRYGRNYTYPTNEIPQYSFYNTSSLAGKKTLASVTIPNSVTTIGERAFLGCSGLTSVTIPNLVTAIESYAFYSCSGLTSVTIPNSITAIESYAFYSCSGLTSITIPNSVTAIGERAFYYCSGLTSVTIPNSVTTIGEYAFFDCIGLTSVTIPNSVTTMGSGAFSSCRGLTSVTIPNSVTAIGERAFCFCYGLTSVTIGNSVTTIGEYAFSGCNGLTELYVKAQTPPAIGGNDVFAFVSATISLHVPCGTASAYQNALGWSRFSNYTDDIPLQNR